MKMASYLTGLLVAVSFLQQAGGGVQILSRETLGEREVRIAPDYSRDKVVDRVSCDFEQPLDLSSAWGVTFAFRTDDLSAFSGFVLLLRTGSRNRPAGWYVYRPCPKEEGGDGWLRMTLERNPSSKSGSPEGFDRISCIRFTGYLAEERRPKEVCFRDFRVLREMPKEESAEARAARLESEVRQLRAIPPKAGERRLAWTRPELHGGEAPDWDAIAARAKRVGITDLIPILSWNGSAYFPSAVTGYRKEFVEKHGDQLEKCLAACRRHGVKCHARKVNWRIFGSKEFLERMRAEGRLQRVLAKSANGSRSAGWRLEDGVWLCPGDPRNRRLEVDAMVELASKGLDGIHYDYIRYDGYSGCYCDGCRARFEARLGRKVANWPADVGSSGAPLVKEWDAYRRETISAVVEEVARRVRRDFPKVEISAAVQKYMPGRAPNAQDWSRWCRERWLDFVCPMDYTNLDAFLENVARPQKKVMDDTGVPVYPGIGLYSSNTRLGPLAAARQIELLRRMGFPGYTFFSLRADTYPDFDRLAEGPCR